MNTFNNLNVTQNLTQISSDISEEQPGPGKLLGKNGFTFVKQITSTIHSEIWELKNRYDGTPIVAKLTDLSVYPEIEKIINDPKKPPSLDTINNLVKSQEIDSVNAKKLISFVNKPTYYEVGYSSQYHKIFSVMNRYNGNMTTYGQDPRYFLLDIINLLYSLHSNFYTFNNISPQDIMYRLDRQENGTEKYNLFLVDFKNVTLFGYPLTQNLTEQSNDFFSLNVIKGGTPTIFDDLESALYVYTFISGYKPGIHTPTFNNSDPVSLSNQITLKTELNYYPEIIRQAIFYLRNEAALNTDLNIHTNIEFIKYVYNNFQNVNQGILDFGLLPVPVVQPTQINQVNQVNQANSTHLGANVSVERKIPPSETALYVKLRDQVGQLRQQNGSFIIPPDKMDDFTRKVIEFILRDQHYDTTTETLIIQFLSISYDSFV